MGAARALAFRTESEVLAFVADRVSRLTGVMLGEKQREFFEGRLMRRLREVGCHSFLEYGEYLRLHETEEMAALTSLLTTHHSYFFREFSQFEFLLESVLPEAVEKHKAKGSNTIRIWSAACSRGQEVYSLAMFLRYHLSRLAPGMNFSILGSDVDAESVAVARNGVYGWNEIKEIPALYMQGNWQRGTGEISGFARAGDQLRKHCEFKTINLLDFRDDLATQMYDMIFCRNVFIYFSKDSITSVTRNFLQHLQPWGRIFVGLSETLNGLNLPLEWIGPSIYSRPRAAVVTDEAPVPAPSVARPLRVVCVDDSKTVLTLMSRVLTRETGFEIVGVAHDGRDAGAVIDRLKPDVVTLDIHMPVVGGVEYLQTHMGPGHPPVVMVSSVSREETGLAFRCLELGAVDYVEKPSLDRLKFQADEIRAKLKSAVSLNGAKIKLSDRLDSHFQKPPQKSNGSKNSGQTLRVLVADRSRPFALTSLITELKRGTHETLVVFESSVDRDSWVHGTNADIVSQVRTVLLSEMDAAAANGQRRTSVLVLGRPSTKAQMILEKLSLSVQVVFEDGIHLSSALRSRATQIVPLTSFAYESERFLSSSEERK